MEALHYPYTPAGDDVVTVAGHPFPDPYRWLEQDNEDVRRWQVAQNELAERSVRSWPHFEAMRQSVRRYFVDRPASLPRHAAGRWFRAQQASGAAPPCVVISDSAYGPGRELPLRVPETNGPPPFLSWIAPSPDGQQIAVGVCLDGSERNFIHLLETDSGRERIPFPRLRLMDAWMGGVCWLPDSSAFYFLALDEPSPVFRQQVWLHDLRTGQTRPETLPLPDPNSSDYTLITASADGRSLLASHGLFAPRPIAFRRLPDPAWRPFLPATEGTLNGFLLGDRFIGITDLDAPRGRIVAIPLDTPDPRDRRHWQELLPESDLVLRSLRPLGSHLILTGFSDTYSTLMTLKPDGSELRQLPLPEKAALTEQIFPLMAQLPPAHPEEHWFVCSSLTQSHGVYRHVPGREIEVIRRPELRLENAQIQDHWANSADGTRVPYHTVQRTDLPTGPRPALIYAYGAFNLPLLPEYPGSMSAFVAAGGIFVHGHIRGGAELGTAWWQDGRMQHKQHGYQDLYAIAEDLLAKGLSAPGMLAMTGRSNGGLMAGVAVAQRPDLWRVVVPQVPVSDVLRMPQDAYGRYALASEYGNPDDPQELLRMAGFSPYHLLRKGPHYPAVHIEAGDTDPRCPPWHARKLAARLQAVSDRPALLRIRSHAGHGQATGKDILLDGHATWLAFILRELGMTPA